MKKFHKLSTAFSMIELIFVIVILGIVASIGSSLIAQNYESYIVQRAVHNASIKTELAINQLANRLESRIDLSMLARFPLRTGYVKNTDVIPIREAAVANVNANMSLEWISYSSETFESTNPPLWSGFTDLNASSFTQLKTEGNLSQVMPTLTNIYTAPPQPALLFMGAANNEYRTGVNYDTLCLYTQNGCISPISAFPTSTTIQLSAAGNRVNAQMVYTEMYQIVASAYAVILEAAPPINGNNVWNLTLKYDYKPWMGEIYTNGQSAILLKNVSVFRFKQEQNSIRIKLCTIEAISDTSQISICKEKAVIR